MQKSSFPEIKFLLNPLHYLFPTERPAEGSTTLTLSLSIRQQSEPALPFVEPLAAEKQSGVGIRMNLMSHSKIICESLFESESQSGRPLQTQSGFGSLVSNEAYFPVFSAAITYKPDPPPLSRP